MAYRTKTGMVKTVCLFDPDTHEEIAKLATSEKTSFAEQVRILTEHALEEIRGETT